LIYSSLDYIFSIRKKSDAIAADKSLGLQSILYGPVIDITGANCMEGERETFAFREDGSYVLFTRSG